MTFIISFKTLIRISGPLINLGSKIKKSIFNNYKIPISDEETIKEAIEWQQTRGARSGRVAWQFILFLAGKYEVNL